MKKLAVGVVVALALGLSACGTPPASTPSNTSDGGASVAPSVTAPAASNYKACLVSDTGGFTDKSFNEAAKKGADQAASELGVQVNAVQSKVDGDYAPNIKSLLSQSCSLIIGVGYKLTPAIVDAAEANPNVHFAIIDDNPEGKPANLKPIIFKTSDAGYLAGYAAAGYSKTGKVATFGGMKFGTVTIFMDGFADGVAKYNADNNASVQLLGWDKASQNGSFADSFDDQAKGQTLTQQFIDQGADVVMPVAGSVGMGATALAKQKGIALVWVDQDGYVSVPQFGDVMLTSVMKGIQPAVYNTIKEEVQKGTFDANPYVGTLANEGVGIAPWHDFESKLPAGLSDKVDALKAQVISGAIKVTSDSDPVIG